ncbi:transposase [Bradyrhizobium diazoefficiens]|uniref:transposase n=1 Tax=Bradyrhizobium diazoefficiens TaxID=1355477 RepID=UPI00190C7B7F|nr:transposase [Bradyrhizobium diazoefficiens]
MNRPPKGSTFTSASTTTPPHKIPAVERRLNAHSRFHLHFTPTSASWLNMIERFFAEITRKRIRHGPFS